MPGPRGAGYLRVCAHAPLAALPWGATICAMTGHSDFTEQEWDLVLQGPPTAGMIVVTSQPGGTFRESLAMGKAYGEARRQHGASQLLDEITGTKPKVDRTRFHSAEELRQHGLERLREAAQLLEQKASEQELDDY